MHTYERKRFPKGKREVFWISKKKKGNGRKENGFSSTDWVLGGWYKYAKDGFWKYCGMKEKREREKEKESGFGWVFGEKHTRMGNEQL